MRCRQAKSRPSEFTTETPIGLQGQKCRVQRQTERHKRRQFCSCQKRQTAKSLNKPKSRNPRLILAEPCPLLSAPYCHLYTRCPTSVSTDRLSIANGPYIPENTVCPSVEQYGTLASQRDLGIGGGPPTILSPSTICATTYTGLGLTLINRRGSLSYAHIEAMTTKGAGKNSLRTCGDDDACRLGVRSIICSFAQLPGRARCKYFIHSAIVDRIDPFGTWRTTRTKHSKVCLGVVDNAPQREDYNFDKMSTAALVKIHSLSFEQTSIWQHLEVPRQKIMIGRKS